MTARTRRLMGLFLDADAVAAAGGRPNAMRLFYHPRGVRPYIEALLRALGDTA